MKPYLALAAAVAVVASLASFAAGSHRRAALAGSTIASFTALASLVAMGLVSRSARKPVKAALGLMTVMFLARILLVGLATVFVVRSGQSILGFVIAFFVPYFAFSAIEGLFVHSLGRAQGPPA